MLNVPSLQTAVTPEGTELAGHVLLPDTDVVVEEDVVVVVGRTDVVVVGATVVVEPIVDVDVDVDVDVELVVLDEAVGFCGEPLSQAEISTIASNAENTLARTARVVLRI